MPFWIGVDTDSAVATLAVLPVVMVGTADRDPTRWDGEPIFFGLGVLGSGGTLPSRAGAVTSGVEEPLWSESGGIPWV
jgi:hypothetical protein